MSRKSSRFLEYPLTYVTPSNDTELKVALRTPGRGVVVEGPSGIGTSTAVHRALQELDVSANVTTLSARRPSDLESIRALPEMGDIGNVIVDDFHRLLAKDQRMLADYLKVLADTEDAANKLVVVGINQAGIDLIRFSTDIVNRIDRIPLEQEPDSKINDLITKGEQALSVTIDARDGHSERFARQFLCRTASVSRDLRATTSD